MTQFEYLVLKGIRLIIWLLRFQCEYKTTKEINIESATYLAEINKAIK